MLFEETINKFKDKVAAAVDQLYDSAYKSQVNENDLLLVIENGLKKEYDEATLKRLKIAPYHIGPDFIDFRYDTFYQFINYYRKGIKSKEAFFKEFEDDKTRKSFLDFYRDFQLLLYMKFWETDLILRRLSNLSNLAQGKPYYWEYSQKVFNDRRNLIKDEIQKPLKDICPLFYTLIDEIYFNQIRNAVAHSQYYFLYSTICFTNNEEKKYYKLNGISYDDWEVMFTKLMLLYNFMIKNFNQYQSMYQDKVKDKHFGLLIYFPEKDLKGLQKTEWVKYDFSHKRWRWNQ
ncbi:MAG: hypothetical protein MUO72_19870 [Bacteroidales bacterium]|nr:hypothetical protein [Bacteroidales bacterium]